ncbi:unnamed protein product [Alopecurus aequalis]
MAAAALGNAARRLLGGGGALRQQTREAAVSRLSSRLAHSEVSCVTSDKDAVFEGIQKKTEELYEAAAELHQKYGMGAQDRACRTNETLLRQLTDHVAERTGDPTWYLPIRLISLQVPLIFFYPYMHGLMMLMYDLTTSRESAKTCQARHDMLKLSGFATMALSGYIYFLLSAWGIKALTD